jgi:predicted metalloprotease with PDZ domain
MLAALLLQLLAPGYTVTVASLSPPRVAVHATITVHGDTLRMERTRACDLPAICSAGWPALVEHLRATDSAGRPLAVTAAGPGGWVITEPHGRTVTIDYSVNYALLAQHHWPAPRETAYADSLLFYTVGRPLFIGTGTDTVAVRFVLPQGFSASAPWPERGADFATLANNGIVFSARSLPRVSAAKFTLDLALFGGWPTHEDTIRKVMGAHVRTFTRLLDDHEPGRYLATFLADSELAGEAYSNSYALSASPDSAVATWSRLIGHELFHYWNGTRLRGADYTTSQWFQEGVTEYYAILSLARNHLITPAAALEQLARHRAAQREFHGSLAASGNRKNRPFYGTATLVAFLLDITIRDATANRRSLDDALRSLWKTFGATRTPYTQADITRVMSKTAGRDLKPFFDAYVVGDTTLPLDSAFARAGRGDEVWKEIVH